MTSEISSKPSNLCPTCGTRVAEDATRCLVCGTDLTQSETKAKKAQKTVQGSRLPQVTLSLPIILLLFLIFIAIGAGLVYFAQQQTTPVVEVTLTPTITQTGTATVTSTPVMPTPSDTPVPSPTPFTYRVGAGDTCSSIAFTFGVSIQSIILMNDLPANCPLFEGRELFIPQPTPTATALPTATLSGVEATRAACGELEYLVQENDTLSSIAINYAISIATLKEYNGLVSDNVRSGQTITIPLCLRDATPGPTPTPTTPPPYPAPNLLLPPDGAPFTLATEAVALQWASVGNLRENEAYEVTVLDVTSGDDRKVVEYVTDTKFNVPNSFRPTDAVPHIFRWTVATVRQTGTDDNGNPIWEPAGALSLPRDFIWVGSGIGVTPTP